MIELLVVIALLTVLIALLMPMLSSARESAKVTVGMSNLRQIQFALHGYAQDSQGSLPFQRAYQVLPLGTSYLPYGSGLLAALGYVNNALIFWGPNRSIGWIGTGAWSSMETTMNSPKDSNCFERTGYGFNNFLMPAQQTGQRPRRVDETLPTHPDALGVQPLPSRVATTAEFYQLNLDPNQYGWWAGPDPSVRLLLNRGQTASIAFLDASVRQVYAEDAGVDLVTGGWASPSIVTFRRDPWFRPD